MIPLYQYPTVTNGKCTGTNYTSVATSKINNRTVAIVNPNNGPAITGADLASFNVCINYLRANQVKVIGYIHTKVGYPGPINGYRSYKDVTADV